MGGKESTLIFALPIEKLVGLTHGVMVTLLILVQSFMVRIHMGQRLKMELPALQYDVGSFYFMVGIGSELYKISQLGETVFIYHRLLALLR